MSKSKLEELIMNDKRKSQFKSKGAVGAIIAGVSGLLQIFADSPELVPVFGSSAPYVTLAGAVLSYIGRWFADSKLKLF